MARTPEPDRTDAGPPPTETVAQRPESDDTASDPDPARSPRVAVVDDEEMLGEAFELVVGDRGRVSLFTDPRRFVRALEDGARYDVIFCDLMMPNLTGMEVYELLRQRHPELLARIVVMTGGAYTERARRFLADVDPPFLSKPFQRDEVLDFIAEIAPSESDASGK